MTIVDLYLSELFRPKDQKKFIDNIKSIYEDMSKLQDKIDIRLSNAIDHIFDDVIKAEAKEETKQGDKLDFQEMIMEIEEIWFSKNGKQDRQRLYRKHKKVIDPLIKKRIKKLKHELPKIKSDAKDFIKLSDKMNQYIKQNKEIYNKIKVRWYNVFGGPVKYNENAANHYREMYEKAIKLPDNKVINYLLAIPYITGQSDSYKDKKISPYLEGNSHEHMLMDY